MFEHITKISSDQIDNLRKQLTSSKGFSIKNVMEILDRSQKGWINAQDIELFIKSHGIQIHIKDICHLVLMHEHDMNGKIDFKGL